MNNNINNKLYNNLFNIIYINYDKILHIGKFTQSSFFVKILFPK